MTRSPDPSTEALRYEVSALIGPCSPAEAEAFLARVSDAPGSFDLGAAWRCSPFDENEAALAARLRQVEEALQVADDFLRRLSEWDVLNLPKEAMSDGPYWQGEIREVRAALAASSTREETR